MSDRKHIEVRVGDHVVRLVDGRWVPADDDERTALLASFAEAVSLTYEYSPAHGEPGHALALLVAEKCGGEAALPPVPPAEEGAIY